MHVEHSPSGPPIKTSVSVIIAEMFRSTLKERYGWSFRLCSLVQCYRQYLLLMTQPPNIIVYDTVSPNNLLDKTSTFLPFCQMFGPAVAAVVPPIPGDFRRDLLPKHCRSEIPQGPLIIIRKVFGRGLAPHGQCQQNIHTFCMWSYVRCFIFI